MPDHNASPAVPNAPTGTSLDEAIRSQRVECRVVGSRPPEASVSRSFGARSLSAAGVQAEVSCAMTFAARRSELAELARVVSERSEASHPLGGPLPPRAPAEPRGAVVVRVVGRSGIDP